MGRVRHGFKLVGEFFQFARQRRAYWLVPLMILLAITGFLIVGGQSVAPLLYTLF